MPGDESLYNIVRLNTTDTSEDEHTRTPALPRRQKCLYYGLDIFSDNSTRHRDMSLYLMDINQEDASRLAGQRICDLLQRPVTERNQFLVLRV
jgi:hypothetical protein